MMARPDVGFWYEEADPHPAEAVLGEAIASFAAEHFELPGLGIRWVRELPAPVGLLVRSQHMVGRICGDADAPADPMVQPKAIDGVAVGRLVTADLPVIVVREGLDVMRLAEVIGHEACHAWQCRAYPEVWVEAREADLEASAGRMGRAVASAWWYRIETDETARVLSVAWERAREKERGV